MNSSFNPTSGRPKIRISVRGLVEFICRGGDIDNRISGASQLSAMEAGSRIHRKIQRQMGSTYNSEVPLRLLLQRALFELVLEGRADGIYTIQTKEYVKEVNKDHMSRVDKKRDSQESLLFQQDSPADTIFHEKQVLWNSEMNPLQGDLLGDDPASITSDVGIPDCFQDDLSDIPSIHDTSEQPGTSPLGGISEQPELPIIPDLSHLPELTVIDEIKGIYKDPLHLTEPIQVHLAQAKCYAYIYALQSNLPVIGVQMTYAHLETEVTRRFYDLYTYEQLEAWFTDLMDQYEKFAELQIRFDEELKSTVQSLTFPFEYRPGQKRLAAAVYRTIEDQKELFIQAPTGIGKTMSVIYPSLKAMGIGHAEKLFYLTAKTITRTVAEETFDILRSQGLKARTVTITAKEKICPLDSCTCNPAECPMAAGHFDRVNDALYDMLTSVEAMSRENILAYAENHQVCPFEFHLDLSLWAQAIICDYNYVFDPSVYLRRFFGENGGGPAGQYIFLVDEAHNLPDRARSMYNGRIIKEDVLASEKNLKETALGKLSDTREAMEAAGRAARQLRKLNKVLLAMKKETAAGRSAEAHISPQPSSQPGLQPSPRSGPVTSANPCPPYIKRENHVLVFAGIDSVYNICIETQDAISSFLEETRHPADESLLEFYFELRHFNAMYEGTYDNYVIYASQERDHFVLNLLCANPAPNLTECAGRAVSTIYFSATLLPLAYYKELLTTRNDAYVIYVDSPFDKKKRFLGISRDVSSRYTQRGPGMYRKVLRYILTAVSSKTGNYMVFFPSYQYMMEVVEILYKEYRQPSHEETKPEQAESEQTQPGQSLPSLPFRLLIQEQGMHEKEREEFLQAFMDESGAGLISASPSSSRSGLSASSDSTDYSQSTPSESPATPYISKSLVGFCVIGGIFAEGIDLTGEKLIGSIVIGTGLPQISTEGNLLRSYFDEQGKDGYDYAYRYPGINKVFQAAGRVIRTVEDQGIVLLLDNRMLQRNHVELFPMDWDNYEAVTNENLENEIYQFWNKNK